MRLLLHTCCGPCFLGVWEELDTHNDIETTLYFDNPNIYPEEEWQKRRANLRMAASGKLVNLIESDYEDKVYGEMIKGIAVSPSASYNEVISQEIRCPHCYRLRLERTAQFAKSHGFEAISTTLFVSPYQQHEVLKKIASEVASAYGVKFYYTDWRPYFRAGQDVAKDLGIYRQRYCGCVYSLRESTILR